MGSLMLMLVLLACEPAPTDGLVCAEGARAREADTDDDGLTDAEELELGTDCLRADSDWDGLSDGDEVYEAELEGADPLHRDLFIELDHEEQYEVRGDERTPLVASAALGARLQQQLVSFFDAVAVQNRDGLDGITLHLVPDGVLPEGFDCRAEDGSYDLPEQWFHHAELCLRKPDADFSFGSNDGQHLNIDAVPVNNDPLDDDREVAQYVWYGIFIHELGHTFGLQHGADDSVNDKPNYLSLMNYRYLADGMDGTLNTLASTSLRFSDGALADAPLVESELYECDSFPGHTLEEIAFLHYGAYPFAVAERGGALCVDWDRDGSFSAEGPVSADINGDGLISDDPWVDVDDFVRIARGVGQNLPGAPARPGSDGG